MALEMTPSNPAPGMLQAHLRGTLNFSSHADVVLALVINEHADGQSLHELQAA